MTTPKHTPGLRRWKAKVIVGDFQIIAGDTKICDVTDVREILPDGSFGPWDPVIGNARLLRASDNAFLTAAEKLGVNPIELAERTDIAELVALLEEVLTRYGRGQIDITDDEPRATMRRWAESARKALAKYRSE